MTARNTFTKICRILWLAFNVLAACVLFTTAYSGMLNPLKYGGGWGILQMTFAAVLFICMALCVAQLFFFRKGALILGLGILACLGPALDVCPLHVLTPRITPGAHVLKVLTYNVHNFTDMRTPSQIGPAVSGNATYSYILRSGADVACLQECEYVGEQAGPGITKAQADSLHAIYPYVMYTGVAMAVLSKYPAEQIHLDHTLRGHGSGDIGAFRITVDDKQITFFTVHLQSIGLTADDKEVYGDLTRLRRDESLRTEARQVREQLLDKLAAAFCERARQTQQLVQYLKMYGGPNAVICGDFNDIDGCYALRTLAGCGMEDAYPRVGFGPMITFNKDRFYFCIDHVLSRGALTPLAAWRGTLKSSDHYPLNVTFAID